MNNKQESKLKMYMAVREFLTENPSAIGTIPNYTKYFADFTVSITEIQGLSPQDALKKKGIAKQKAIYRTNLINMTYDICSKLAAYASHAGDQALLNEIQHTKSALERANDMLLVDIANAAQRRASPHLAALITYNFTFEKLTAYNDTIQQFLNAIPQARLNVTNQKENNSLEQKAFDNTDAILKQLDLIVDTLRIENPSFYSNYKNVRKIISTGNSSFAVKGTISDTNGEAIKGVNISFAPGNGASKSALSKSEKPVTKQSSEKGGFNLKSIPEGVYQVSFSKTGYETQTVEVVVNDGELSVVNVELKKL